MEYEFMGNGTTFKGAKIKAFFNKPKNVIKRLSSADWRGEIEAVKRLESEVERSVVRPVSIRPVSRFVTNHWGLSKSSFWIVLKLKSYGVSMKGLQEMGNSLSLLERGLPTLQRRRYKYAYLSPEELAYQMNQNQWHYGLPVRNEELKAVLVQ